MSSKRKHRAAAAEVFAQQNVANLRDAPASEAQQVDSFYAGEDDYYNEMPEFELAKAAIKPAAPPAPIIMGGNAPIPQQAQDYQRKMTAKDDLPALYAFKTSEELQLEKEPIQVRETGFLFWKRVIVPPNAYVVHTRAGRNEPV